MMKKLLMLAVAALLIVGCSEQQLLDDYMSEVSEMSEMQEPGSGKHSEFLSGEGKMG